MEIITILMLFLILEVGLVLATVFALNHSKKIVQLKESIDNLQHQQDQTTFEKNKLEVELNEIKNNLTTNFLHDPVTGLPGRSVFEDWLVQVLNQSMNHKLLFSIILLDIDDFKMINNVLGQEAGNTLLKEMAERFKTCVRQIDMISHYANDEFAFLLPQITKAETAAYVAQQLLEAAASPFRINDQELFITASVGIAMYPGDGQEMGTLLKNADIALQQAKVSGGNTHQFYREELYNESHRELILSSSLRSSAIHNEFVLYYLPQINTQTKKIISVEALLRWHHPELGLVKPQDFLRLTENNGTINAIGDWVLKNACQQYKTWHDSGFTPDAISVNVSLRQLENTNFTYRLSQILQETKLDPQALILEISESVILPRLELVEKTLQMLKHLRVQVAIDDFGTGFLSLQHLRRFPVGYLKIDNTLTREIVSNNESEAIVKMIINLATSLKITTVAEGVETVEQKEKLKELGCHIMQGYYFSKPILPQEFTSKTIEEIYNNV